MAEIKKMWLLRASKQVYQDCDTALVSIVLQKYDRVEKSRRRINVLFMKSELNVAGISGEFDCKHGSHGTLYVEVFWQVLLFGYSYNGCVLAQKHR